MMKRFLTAALAISLTLSLVACGNNNDSSKLPSASTGDTSVLGADFQKDMHQSSSEWFGQICETSEGYYFQHDLMVYYIDKETGESTALCASRIVTTHIPKMIVAVTLIPMLAFLPIMTENYITPTPTELGKTEAM